MARPRTGSTTTGPCHRTRRTTPDRSVRSTLDLAAATSARSGGAAVTLDVGAETPVRRHRQRRPRRHSTAARSSRTSADNSDPREFARAFAEATWSPTDKLRLIGGLRGDAYDFDVTAKHHGSARETCNDGRVRRRSASRIRSDRRRRALRNWGKGFHSNDARGVVNADVPSRGSRRAGQGSRRALPDRHVHAHTAYWWLELGSELIFVGDSNAVEPKGGSEREGYELVSFWRPSSGSALDGVYTGSTARYDDNPDGSHVEGSMENAGELGISAVRRSWEASLRVRYLGEYPLTPTTRSGRTPRRC